MDLALSYALSDAELHYIQQAVLYVATYGFIFLPEYIYFSETAEWKHVSIRNKKPYRRWLNKVRYMILFLRLSLATNLEK